MLGHHDMGLETSRCGFESRNAHRFGLKVFMDARQPVTLEEGDRYPLGPPSFVALASGSTLAAYFEGAASEKR